MKWKTTAQNTGEETLQIWLDVHANIHKRSTHKEDQLKMCLININQKKNLLSCLFNLLQITSLQLLSIQSHMDWCRSNFSDSRAERQPPGLLQLQLILCSWQPGQSHAEGQGLRKDQAGGKQGQDRLRSEEWVQGGPGWVGRCRRQEREGKKGFAPFQLVFSSSCLTDHSNR